MGRVKQENLVLGDCTVTDINGNYICTCKEPKIVAIKPKYNGNILNAYLTEPFGELEQRLKDIGVECRNEDGTIKRTIDILAECAEKWEELSK